MYIIIAIIMFGLLIAIHEFGHFTAAKSLGVKVNEFAIGMGPALFKRQKGDTLYAIRLLPIGGYCAMEGEDEDTNDPRGFANQAVWKKFIILAAGSFMNFLLGLALLLIVSHYGGFTMPTVTDFMPGSPYESVEGLQVGDTFYEIDGHRIYSSNNISSFLARGGDTHDITVLRDGEKVTLEDYTITLREYEGESELRYGFYFGERVTGFWKSIQYSWYCAIDFVREVWMALSDLVGGVVGIDQLSGPVGIVSMINEVGHLSQDALSAFLNIAYFAAFIAINLAVMNILPLPALDGGRIFFLLIGVITRLFTKRKLDPKYEGYVHSAGMVLLLCLMAYVMYNDITRVIN